MFIIRLFRIQEDQFNVLIHSKRLLIKFIVVFNGKNVTHEVVPCHQNVPSHTSAKKVQKYCSSGRYPYGGCRYIIIFCE